MKATASASTMPRRSPVQRICPPLIAAADDRPAEDECDGGVAIGRSRIGEWRRRDAAPTHARERAAASTAHRLYIVLDSFFASLWSLQRSLSAPTAHELYSCVERCRALQLYSALHSTRSTPSLCSPLAFGLPHGRGVFRSITYHGIRRERSNWLVDAIATPGSVARKNFVRGSQALGARGRPSRGY